MKLEILLSYLLSILEGALSGVCFYEAEREECPWRKFVGCLLGAVFFVLSLLESIEASRKALAAWAARKAEKEAEIDIYLDDEADF